MSVSRVAAQIPDWALPHGYFYTQAGGDTADPSDGFPVVNHVSYGFGSDGGQRVRFWDEFQRYGGVAVVGYPASRPFVWDGFNVQVFQKGVFQWRDDEGPRGEAWFMNVFDEFTRHGLDQRLLAEKHVPLPEPFDDQGQTFDQVTAERWALLESRPAFAAQYWRVPDPLALYGLPTSQVQDFGPFYVLRLQRAAFQEWKVDAPGIARAGEVTVLNGGDVAKELGLIPAWTAVPLQPAAVSEQIVVYTPGQGEAVWSPFTVVGDARAFEATVVWELTDNAHGGALSRGFTTARACCEWARFHVEALYAIPEAGAGTLAVWGASGRGDDRPGEVRMTLQLDPLGRPAAAQDAGRMIQPLRVQVEDTFWTVHVRVRNESGVAQEVVTADFRLHDAATGKTYFDLDGLVIPLREGEAEDVPLRFQIVERVDPLNLRLLHGAGGAAQEQLVDPIVIDLPEPS